MKPYPFLNFIRTPVFIGLLMFSFLMTLTQFLSYERYLLLKDAEFRALNSEASAAKERLQTALSYSLSTAQTLGFMVERYGIPRDFDTVAKKLLVADKFIDAVELVEGGVITHVYPLKGNEAVIGYDILKDSIGNRGAYTAIETKKFFWAGPIKLKQGGVGLVGRQPLFKEDKFWGFSAVIIKLNTFLHAVGIDSNTNNGFYYQLSRVNTDNNTENFFLPNYLPSKNALAVPVEIPNGEWRLYVAKKNKATLFFAITFSLLGLILSLTGGLFAWFMARQPKQLNDLVKQKTAELINTENNLHNTLERVSDAFVAIDKNFCYTYMNKKAGEIFKRDPEKIVGKNMWEEFPEWVGKPFYYTFLQAMKDQKYILLEEHYEKHNLWFESHIYPSATGLSIFLNETSDRKRAEQELLREKNLSDSIINSLPGAFYLYDQNGKFIRWNKNFETVSGYSTEEVSRMHPLDFFDTGDKEILEKKIAAVFSKGMAEVEAPLLTKYKQKVDYYFNGHLANLDGKDYLIGMGIDITDRKKAELERNKAYKEKETALNRINDGVVSVDNEWRYTFINDAAIVTNPAGRANVIGKNIWEVHPGMIGTILWDKYHEAMETRKVVEVETYYEPLNFWAYVKVYPSADGLTFFYRDITEQKKAEQEIILEKNLSESVINSLPGIFYLADLNGKMLRWNKNFEIVSGYSADEIQNMRVRDFVALNNQQDVLMKKQLAIDKGVSDLETNFLTNQKQELPFHFTSVLSKYKNEPCLLGVGIDIAERKKAELALLESEENYRYLFNNNPALIIIWDPATLKILEVNDQANILYGYTREEFLNMTVLDYRPKEDFQKIKDFAHLLLTGNEPIQRGIWKHLKRSGEIMYMDISSHRIDYKNIPAILSLGKDITAQWKAEEQLKKTYDDIRRLNAHLHTIREEERTSISRELHDELGQQLTALKMDVVWIAKKLINSDAAIKEKIAEASELIDDTVKVVRRINTELRPGILDDLGLFAALEWQATEFSKRTGVVCDVQLCENEPVLNKNISINIFRIFQETLTNITKHAQATMVKAELKNDNKNLVMTISDNGIGFDVEEVKTKKSFGLLGMKERALAMNGEIKVSSEQGKGSSIFLTVPINI